MRNLRSRRVPALVLVAAGLLTALSGCTAAAIDESGPSVQPRSAGSGFACPAAAEVSDLLAADYSRSSDSAAASCSYRAGDGRRIVIVHGARSKAPTLQTLSRLRSAQPERAGARAVSGLSRGSFTSRNSAGGCTAWVYAVDGAVTTVTAQGGSRSDSCSAAKAAAALVSIRDRAQEPLVTVLLPDAIATSSASRAWVQGIARRTDTRLQVLQSAGSGYRGGYVDTASRVPERSAAVVVVTTGTETQSGRLTFLRAATTTLSTVRQTAPDAALLVVGSLGSTETALSLDRDLQSAAKIAEARYVAPTSSEGLPATLSTAEDAVTEAIRALQG